MVPQSQFTHRLRTRIRSIRDGISLLHLRQRHRPSLFDRLRRLASLGCVADLGGHLGLLLSLLLLGLVFLRNLKRIKAFCLGINRLIFGRLDISRSSPRHCSHSAASPST